MRRRTASHLRRWFGHGVAFYAIGPWGAHAAQLPVPCAAGTCGTGNPAFVTSGKATATQAGKTLTVTQTTGSATLNWASFNIGADGKVAFQQPSTSAIALNRIYDANPSAIFGALTANGQVYLINANGFLFGAGSTVNVAGMIASSLNITDSTFSSGILAPLQSNLPALEQFTTSPLNFATSAGTKLQNTGSITVQDGARLAATGGGRLLLAAPTIVNDGSLAAPDGQIVLAAGQNIYLQASNNPGLRGLIVEVDGGTSAAGALASLTNGASGVLSAPRGNITLTGLMINQDGRISATTSVAANGSIVLEAADGVNFNGTSPITARAGGQLVTGPDSLIDVLPELADKTTAVAAQPQLQSTITLDGLQVLMHGGTIDAPSGVLTVTAEASPGNGVTSGDNQQARIRIDAGTTIDLAGSNAELPMAANLLTVQLRANEFKDDPTQRNGALRGDTVTIDIRADNGAGTPIADVSGAIAGVGQNIAQRTEAGGKAVFASEGDVVFNPGASIDVSGGHTTYDGGTIQTTALVGANGQLYDIGHANPLLTYTGVVNPTYTQVYDKWGIKEVIPTPGLSHYESGYIQGAAAGSVQFAAPGLALGGTLRGSAVNGPYQRGPVGNAYGDAVAGATLIIGDPGGAAGNKLATLGQVDYLAPPVVVAMSPAPVTVADDVALPAQTLQLPATYLTDDGFANFQVYTNTTFAVPAGMPLVLAPGSSFLVRAPRVDIDSSLTDPGGSLNFASVLTVAAQDLNAPTLGPGMPRFGVGLGDGVTLDVSGQWTNDGVLAEGVGSGPTLQNGGSINLQLTQPAGEIAIGNGVSLIADGGAWLQSGGSFAYGTGGAITLDASPSQTAMSFGRSFGLAAFGAGTAKGGSFALSAPRIRISGGTGSAWTASQRIDDSDPATVGTALNLYAPLFSDLGFSNISLTATGAAVPGGAADAITIAAGTRIVAQTRSLRLDPGYESRRTGGTIDGYSAPALLPLYERPVTNVSLNVLREADDFPLQTAAFGAIDMQAGSSIVTDPGASIAIAGEGDILIDGTLRAPGGSISVVLLSPLKFNSVTAPIFDPGYLPDLGIDIGAGAIVDVSGGSAVMTPNSLGLELGTVRSGGSVRIQADRGTLVAEAGSLIDIAGTSAALDVANAGAGGYTREIVATSGGSLSVGSVESIALLGNIDGRPGSGGHGAAAAGALQVDLERNEVIAAQPDANGGTMQIDLVASTAGQAAAPGVNLAEIGVAQLLGYGIDSLTLIAGGGVNGNISLDTAQKLALGRGIVLQSQELSVADGVAASIAAPYIAVGNPQSLPPGRTQPGPTGGSGSLSVAASQQLTLFGDLSLQGIGDAVFASQGDVQLQGTSTSASGPVAGNLLVAGNLAIDAARVYPDTFTDFTIQSVTPAGSPIGNTVTIGQTRASPGTPLSAGGSVTVSADNVVVGGTLVAPFGQIALDANESLTLLNGSLVSVSGAGLDVPYGQTTANAGQWLYQNALGTQTSVTTVPTKQVTLAAPNITVERDALVDLKGGGDLYAYEWVPGSSGSRDALAGSGVYQVPGLYAIIPTQAGQAAPYDPQESAGYSPTQTVYLSGGAGVAAGYYALLPPRYALLPGARLIQVEPGYGSTLGGQIGALANGVPVIAGHLGSTGTTLYSGSTTYEGFAIYPGGYGQQLAAYTISQASGYFTGIAAQAGTGPVGVPADAGSLTFNVLAAADPAIATIFDLQGRVLTGPASGGRGAQVNISAPDLEITAGNASAGAGVVAVSGSVLQAWNASELTLGGSAAVNGTNVTVAANSVTVDAGVQLSADQILLVAGQSIDVRSGATLSTTAANNGTVLATLPATSAVTLTDAGGNALPGAALLAVSDVGVPLVTRSGPAAGGATIDVAQGATLKSGGALALDAPGQITLAGTLDARGAAWSLASDSIAFVGAGTSADTLNIDTATVGVLQQAGSVRLSSQGNIDVLAPLTLGATSAGAAPTLKALTLAAAQINNQTGGDLVLGATNMTLEGAGTAPAGGAVTPVGGGGTLNLVAGNLTIGPNTLAISGFGNTVAQVSGAIETAGTGGLSTAGDLTLNAAMLTPGAGSQTAITTSGKLTIGAPPAAGGGTKPAALVGGSLALTAASIADAGVIAAPSGIVTLNATAGDIDLTGGATVTVAGTTVSAANRSAASPGGMLDLNASGNVNLGSGTTLDVSGRSDAPAGTLGISAGGVATLSGALQGAAGTGGTGGTGGSFVLDAGQLAGGLDPLAAKLAGGGFSDAVNVRVRSGDLDLSSGTTIAASTITLTADAGAVNIGGMLTAASAAQRGLIDLSSGTVVTLGSTGQLHADGLAGSGLGGEIDINATCPSCSIVLDPGSVITAMGSAHDGQLVLRAPAIGSQNDVAVNDQVGINGIGADVSHAGTVIVEPVMVVQTSGATVNGDLANAIVSASDFLTAATPVITARLAGGGGTPLSVQAGVELQDSNVADTLVLKGLVDLSQYSDPAYYGGTQAPQVINLGVRAAGSISINGTISDGFIADQYAGTGQTALSTMPSATLSFVAGADTGSANPLSVLNRSGANLTLVGSLKAPDGTPDGVGPSVVRTGTGDLSLVASGQVQFNAGTSAYTGGAQPLDVIGPAGFFDLQNRPYLQNFGAGGGTVLVSAGTDVVGSPAGSAFANVDFGNFGVSGWLLRQGNAQNPAQYGVNFGAFDWSVGALGGGDVRIVAGGNVTNVSAAASDNLVAGTNLGTGQPTNPSVLLGAGGGLTITAGGDIGSAQVYVADGVGTLIAGGGLPAVRNVPKSISSSNLPVGSSIAMGDSQVSVWARNAVQVNALYDPTVAPQLEPDLSPDSSGVYFTYGAKSGATLSSTAGAVIFEPNTGNGTMATLIGPKEVAAGAQFFAVAPPSLAIRALQGDIDLDSGVYLFPSVSGQLSLFAGRDIVGNVGGFTLSDSAPATIPTAANPQVSVSQASNAFAGLLAFQAVLHAGDTSPASVVAGRDIDDLVLSIPKAATVAAGRDIVNLQYAGQQESAGDVTLVAAGRDLVDHTGAANFPGIGLGGPGSLDVLTGRNLNLGFGDGITTTGSLENANLATPAGAAINLMVGYGSQGADLAGFTQSVIATSATYRDQLVAYVEARTGTSGLSFAQAERVFQEIPTSQQAALVDSVFFNELLLSGRAANSGSGAGFTRGYAAIDALYPGSRSPASGASPSYAGDLTLTSSNIFSLSGGAISITVPGGRVDVGLANPPPTLSKSADQLGIVAEGTGNVDIYALGDVNVNQSRVFTLGGGNILIWSDLGSIDAGNGSKSSLSVPPPRLLISSTGSVTLDFAGTLASGSGIRTIQTSPSVAAGDVDLIAPVGTVNAGDAGIGAAGNINIAAAHVIGAGNINFGGTAAGVPSDVSGLATSLSGASGAAAGATSSGTATVGESGAGRETAPLAQAALNWLDVFVTGLGEDNCRQDDIECLKRQKTAAP